MNGDLDMMCDDGGGLPPKIRSRDTVGMTDKNQGHLKSDLPRHPSPMGREGVNEGMAHATGPYQLDRTLGLQEDRYSQYIGPTTDFEPSLINLSAFDTHDESLLARGTLRKVSDHDTFLLLPDSTTPGHDRQLQDLDEIENIVAPHGRRLIDLYFHVIHPGLPILQKTLLYEQYENSRCSISPALLAAMYILALNWWQHSEELSSGPRPDVRKLERLVRTSLADFMFRPKLSTVQAGLLLSQRPEGDQWAPTAQLIAIAQELGLHLDCGDWKIPDWEKGLRKRLAWALYMQDKWGALVHGRPSHIFASNWVVQQLSEDDFPAFEREEGGWGGGGDDVGDDNDDKDRVDDQQRTLKHGRLLFMEMVRLTQILAEILETFYTIPSMQPVDRAASQGTHLVLALARPIQLKLKEWSAGVPAPIRMDSTYHQLAARASASRLSCVGYLHLAYYATEITLHRRIIRSIDADMAAAAAAAAQTQQARVANTSSSHTPRTTASGGSMSCGSTTHIAMTSNRITTRTSGENVVPPSAAAIPTTAVPTLSSSPGDTAVSHAAAAVAAAAPVSPYMQHVCRSAAKTRLISAMDFVNRLTPNHLRAFWYFASKTNFALIGTFGSLLWATSPGREEADWYRRRLAEYRWTLSVSSKPGEGKGLTEFAMGMLDISTGLLRMLPEKPSLSRSGSASDLDRAAPAWSPSARLFLGAGAAVAGGMAGRGKQAQLKEENEVEEDEEGMVESVSDMSGA